MKALHRFLIPCVGALSLWASGCGDNDTCEEGEAQIDGMCVPATQCGVGTTPDPLTNECVPDGSMVCDQGTVFDPDSGTCKIDPNSCAAGTVFINNECIPEDEALEGMADHVEAPEPNDGQVGIAGSFDAPAMGSTVSIFGCIEPRADADGDGDLDPDRDVWVINASEPMLLDFTADGIRGLNAAFAMVSGDAAHSPSLDTWQRLGVNNTGDTSARQVYLPLAGTYALFMADSRDLLDGRSAGADDACYFTTMEQVALPAATPMVARANTLNQKGDVALLSHNGANNGDILLVLADAPTAPADPGFVVLRNGAFFAASEGVASLGNLQTAGDEITIISDPVINFALTPQPFVFDALFVPGLALPTDGSTLTITQRSGDLGGLAFAEADYLFFDVADGGAVVHFDLTSTIPTFLSIFEEQVFDTPSGAGLIMVPISDFTGQTDTFTGEFVRFLDAGRYYMQSFDPDGVSAATYDMTVTLTPVLPNEITYGTPLANQTLPATGSGFHFVDPGTPIWSAFSTDGADLGANVDMLVYDLAGEGMLNANYTPILGRTVPSDGSPAGTITDGLDVDLLVQVRPAQDPVIVDPTYEVNVEDRAFTEVDPVDDANPQAVDDDPTLAGVQRRYFIRGTEADRVTALLTPGAGADGSLVRINRAEQPIDTANENGADGTESLRLLVENDPEDFFAYTVTTDIDSTVDINWTAQGPVPFDIAAGALVFADVCADAGAVEIFNGFADDSLSAPQALPFALSFFGDPVDTYTISSNGWLALGDAGFNSQFAAQDLPANTLPNGVVAPFWADHTAVSACVLDAVDRVTIQWTGELFVDAAETIEFQAIIHDDGVIDFVYGANHVAAGDEPFSSVVGAEDVFGAFGHEIFEDEAGIAPGDSHVLTPQ